MTRARQLASFMAASPASIHNFGAYGTGLTNDTAAFAAAISAGGELFIPPGVYRCDPSVFTGLNGITITGANKQTSIIELTGVGILWRFTGAQWVSLRNLGFRLGGTPQGVAFTYGVQFDGASGNCTADDCMFLGFASGGLMHVGTGGGISGMVTRNCMFLGNGAAQFYAELSSDYHIEDNQYGILAGVAHADYGCHLVNCGAGNYEGNYHWNNTVGLLADTCNYATYSQNRFEESDHENVIIDGGNTILFSDNKAYTASGTATGVYDNVKIIGASSVTISDNKVFSWNALRSRWGISLETGCTNIKVSKNEVMGWNTSYGPWGVASGVDVSPDASFEGATNTTTVAAETSYIGAQIKTYIESQASRPLTRRCQLLRMYVASDAAPGAGQSYTYTLRENAADTAMVATIAGASGFSASAMSPAPAILLGQDENISIKHVSSSGAASANHRWSLAMLEY